MEPTGQRGRTVLLYTVAESGRNDNETTRRSACRVRSIREVAAPSTTTARAANQQQFFNIVSPPCGRYRVQFMVP